MWKGLWYGFDRDERGQAIDLHGDVSQRAPIPTTPPHPLPGGEYDRDGFLYRHHVVESLRHDRVRLSTAALLVPYLRRLHGDRALVASDCGLYPRPVDRFAKPLAPDIMVSLTAGDLDAPGTAPDEDRMSYKLWQEPVPDLILEVVSWRSVTRDTVEKPKLYEKLGVAEFWLVDPHRLTDAPDGLRGAYLVDGRYQDARARTPGAHEAPLPPGAVTYWSDVLGLYLYTDGRELRFHHPVTGRIRDFAEESDARVAAEESISAAESARREAEERIRSLEAELHALRGE